MQEVADATEARESRIESFGMNLIEAYGQEAPAIIEWDVLSEMAGIDIVDRERDEFAGLDRYGHVLQRNGIKTQFNSWCRATQQPYQLFVQEPGTSVVLRKGDDAVYAEEVRLFGQVAKRVTGAKKVTEHLSDLKGLKPSTRKQCKALASGFQGLGMVLHGMVSQLSLPTAMKRQLLAEVTEILIPEESEEDESED